MAIIVHFIIFNAFVCHAGDQSASETSQQAEVDRRIQLVIDMEDVDVLPDLRSHNSGKPSNFQCCWKKCEEFLTEDIGVAVKDR